jgi:hypothetical protein
MITQTVIVIFNKRVGADRREVFYPTTIDSASYQEVRSSQHSAGNATESLSYKIRIPGCAYSFHKGYLPEAAYRRLSAEQAADHFWTIQKGDVILAGDIDVDDDPIDAAALEELARANDLDVIHVVEYADNTMRGSSMVRHWRIGGA